MRLAREQIAGPPEAGARALARALLAAADRQAGRMAADRDDPEALHDFRVALRRLRTVLRALDPWLDVPERLHHRLERCARATNAARDAEVHLAWIDGVAAGLTRRHRHGAAFLRALLQEESRAAPSPARVVERYGRVAGRLSMRLERQHAARRRRAGAAPPFGAVLATLVREQLREVEEGVAAVGGPLDEEAIHSARIEAKRLRYLLEPLRDPARPRASSAVEHLKGLQDLLGGLHDVHVLAREVRRAMVAAARDDARALHRLVYERAATRSDVGDLLQRRPRPGLVAITRLLRDRRDALFAELERTWRGGVCAAVAEEVRGVAVALVVGAGDDIGPAPASRSSPAPRAGRGLRQRGGTATRAPRRVPG